MRTPHDRQVIEEARQIKLSERKAAKKARPAVDPIKRDRGRVRDNAHLAFVRRLPCVATWVRHGVLTAAASDAAHIRAPSIAHGKSYTGKQVKPSDCWTLPLCRAEHEAQHGGGELTYWADLGVNPFDLAQMIYNVTGNDSAALTIIQGLKQ